MRRWMTLLACAALPFMPASSALAITIVDTGTPTGSGAWDLAGYQWLAGEFTTTETHTLTHLHGYIASGAPDPMTFTVALYSDGGEVPGTELFSGTAAFDGPGEGWAGLSGVSWTVAPGTYWIAFEVRPDDTFWVGGFRKGAPMPLADEAFWFGGVWSGHDALDLGVRITTDPAAVPEPSTLGLLAIGLAALGMWRGRRADE